MKKTYAEQIKDLEATLLAKREKMDQIMTKAADEGRSTDDDESEAFDALEAECSKLVKDIGLKSE